MENRTALGPRGEFSQVMSKFRWAEHQIATLDLAVADYVALNPYVSVVEDQPGAQAYKVVAHLRYPPPAAIAHIVTDVLNSLHGTLDYLAWQLVLREGEIPDERCAFPIKVTETDPAQLEVNVFRAKETGRGLVSQLSDAAALDILRAVQPSRLPEAERDSHPLQILRRRNRECKHRHPAILATTINQGHYVYLTNTIFGQPLPEGMNVAMHTANFSPLKDGDEMAWVSYLSKPDGPPPDYDDFATFVSFEDGPVDPGTGSPVPVTEALMGIASFIEDNILVPVARIWSNSAW